MAWLHKGNGRIEGADERGSLLGFYGAIEAAEMVSPEAVREFLQDFPSTAQLSPEQVFESGYVRYGLLNDGGPFANPVLALADTVDVTVDDLARAIAELEPGRATGYDVTNDERQAAADERQANGGRYKVAYLIETTCRNPNAVAFGWIKREQA